MKRISLILLVLPAAAALAGTEPAPSAADATPQTEPALFCELNADNAVGEAEALMDAALVERLLRPPADGPAPDPALRGWDRFAVRGSYQDQTLTVAILAADAAAASNAPAARAALSDAFAPLTEDFPDLSEPEWRIRPVPAEKRSSVASSCDGQAHAAARLLETESRCRRTADPDAVRPAWDFALLGSAPEDALRICAPAPDASVPPGACVRIPEACVRDLRALRWLSADELLVDCGAVGRFVVRRAAETRALVVDEAPDDAPAAVSPDAGRPRVFRNVRTALCVRVVVPAPRNEGPGMLSRALRAPLRDAAERALAAAFPERPEPVRTVFRPVTGNGGLLFAGPFSPEESARAEAALADVLAPSVFPLPDGYGPLRLERVPLMVGDEADGAAPLTVLSVLEPFLNDGSPTDPVWRNGGDAPELPSGPSLWVPTLVLARDRVPPEDLDEIVLLPIARLLSRADWARPGAEPLRCAIPACGGVVIVPLREDADLEAARADAEAKAAVLHESFPEWAGLPRPSVRPAAPSAPAADAAFRRDVAVRSALFDAALALISEPIHEVRESSWLQLLRDAVRSGSRLADGAGRREREASEDVSPALAACLGPGWRHHAPWFAADPAVFNDDLVTPFCVFRAKLDAALRSGAPEDFADLLDPSAAESADALAWFAGLRRSGPGFVVGNQVWIRPPDADGRAALAALLPQEEARLGRILLATVLRTQSAVITGGPVAPASPAASDFFDAAVMPVVLEEDGSLRILPASAWSLLLRVRPDVAAWGEDVAAATITAPPRLRTPAAEDLAAGLRRVAETGSAEDFAELLHPLVRDAPDAFKKAVAARLAGLRAFGEPEVVVRPLCSAPFGLGEAVPFREFRRAASLPDAEGLPDWAPLSARVPGLWVSVAVCLPSGAGPVCFLESPAVETNGRLLLLPVVPDARSPEPDAAAPVRRRLAFENAESDLRAFEDPWRAALRRLGDDRTANFSYLFGARIPEPFRKRLGLPPEADDFLIPSFAPGWRDDAPASGRETSRMEFVARSGLATELDPAARPLPVIDLAPGETLRVLPRSSGVTSAELTIRPDDNSARGGPSLSVESSWNERRPNGRTSSSRSQNVFPVYDARAGMRGVEAVGIHTDALDGSENYEAGFTWAPATNGAPRIYYGALPDPGLTNGAALLRRFLAAPEATVAAAPEGLNVFAVRLVPKPGDGEPPPPVRAFEDLRPLFAPRPGDLLRFERDGSVLPAVETKALGPNRRLRVEIAADAPDDGPAARLELALRASAVIETRAAPGEPWTEEPGSAFALERRVVWTVVDDGTISMEGDLRGLLSEWGISVHAEAMSDAGYNLSAHFGVPDAAVLAASGRGAVRLGAAAAFPSPVRRSGPFELDAEFLSPDEGLACRLTPRGPLGTVRVVRP